MRNTNLSKELLEGITSDDMGVCLQARLPDGLLQEFSHFEAHTE